MLSHSPLPLIYGQAVLQKLIFHLPAISLHQNGNLLIVYLLQGHFLVTTLEKTSALQ